MNHEKLPHFVVTCGDPKCPRHQRSGFNGGVPCTAAPPRSWPPLEERRWYKRPIATPRDSYGMGSVQGRG